MLSNIQFRYKACNALMPLLKNKEKVILYFLHNDHQAERPLQVGYTPNIRLTAKAQLPGSITVKTGVLLGICNVE